MITSPSDPQYSALDLGFNRLLIKPSTLSDTPEMVNFLTGGVAAKSLDSGELLGNTVVKKGYIQSENFVTGVSGWKLDYLGNLEANDGTFRGALGATTGTIGGWTIGATTLTGGDLTLDSTGIVSIILGLGTLQLNSSGLEFYVGAYYNSSVRLRTGVGPVGASDTVEMAFSVGSSATDFTISAVRTASNVGHFSRVSGSVADLGTTGLRWETIYLVNNPDVSSSVELKKEIVSTRYGLKDILKLEPVEYKWKIGDNKLKIGLIAEEVKKIIPEAAPDEGSYRPGDLIPILVQAIKDLNNKIEYLEKEINKLK